MKALNNAVVHIIKGMALICYLIHQQVELLVRSCWRWLRIVPYFHFWSSPSSYSLVLSIWVPASGHPEWRNWIVFIFRVSNPRHGQDISPQNRPDRLAGQLSQLFNEYWSCVILDFRHQAAEDCTLLGYYAACSGNFLPTFRDNLLVPSSMFNLKPEDGNNRESRNVGKKLPLHATL